MELYTSTPSIHLHGVVLSLKKGKKAQEKFYLLAFTSCTMECSHIGGMEVNIHSSLTSSVDGCECLDLRAGHLYFG
jgi:hypothetical protein